MEESHINHLMNAMPESKFPPCLVYALIAYDYAILSRDEGIEMNFIELYFQFLELEPADETECEEIYNKLIDRGMSSWEEIFEEEELLEIHSKLVEDSQEDEFDTRSKMQKMFPYDITQNMN